MKIFIFPFLLLISICSLAQNLTGIWRGTFIQNSFDMYKGKPIEEKYKYEIQINNLKNNAVEGVTYSYKTTVFYGKASMQGIYTKNTNNLIIRELKMLELKISDNTSPCLMTCYLDYNKNSLGKETLTGTFTSVSGKNKDCGSGTVYLEKVPTSDFEKETFLLKNKSDIEIKKTVPNTTTVTPNDKKILTKPPSTTTKPSIKPGAEVFVIANEPKKNLPKKQEPADTIKPTVKPTEKKLLQKLPIPKVLIERENNLQKIIIVDQQDVQIDLYDNGQIDNDSISVYHNNKLLINRGRLNTKPLTLIIHLDENNPFYELITVAENLGDVPPNTALMVITAGKKRYEVTITSDDKRNAKVLLQYKPTEKNK
ncbi:MAG: hypothetical protein H7101_06535 [Deinococcales bacterium]|nr:hypothetical protein [Chitinophagaceae bacterium]